MFDKLYTSEEMKIAKANGLPLCSALMPRHTPSALPSLFGQAFGCGDQFVAVVSETLFRSPLFNTGGVAGGGPTGGSGGITMTNRILEGSQRGPPWIAGVVAE